MRPKLYRNLLLIERQLFLKSEVRRTFLEQQRLILLFLLLSKPIRRFGGISNKKSEKLLPLGNID